MENTEIPAEAAMITSLPHEALILETDRLRLTPFCSEDADIAHRLLEDPKVMRYVGDPITAQAVEDHMANAIRRGAGGRIGIWCVTRMDTGEKIGDCVLTPLPVDSDEIDWDQLIPDSYPRDEIEIGYLLVPAAWGQGFATELCARLLRFAFEETTLPLITAVTDPDNANSRHVLQKCGLRPTGPRRAYAEDNCSGFEITREEWVARFGQAV
ncbi:MAG: GNAT family N-acetyltransferase [Rhodobacteraceae bacterium]|nr:GNAT family N-acetyltransferase [Paracoccaceae bacterium]